MKRKLPPWLAAKLDPYTRAGLRKPAAKTPRRSKRRTSRKPRAAAAGKLRTVLLGEPVELIYRHAQGGTYSHKFRGKGKHRVSFTPDGRLLVIDGGSVRAFIE